MRSGSLISLDTFECSLCSGRGWLGVLGETTGYVDAERDASGRVIAIRDDEWRIPATFSRGMVSGITCAMEWWMANGERAVREWPVERVVVSDREPGCRQGGWEGKDIWWGDFNGAIPNEISNYYEMHPTMYWGRPTEAAARAALSSAAIAWAREEAEKDQVKSSK